MAMSRQQLANGDPSWCSVCFSSVTEESYMAKRYEDRYGRGGYRRDRDYADDRGYMERAGDEVRSWFGDEEAERRRDMDELRDRRRDYREQRGAGNYQTRSDYRDDYRSDYRRDADWNRDDERSVGWGAGVSRQRGWNWDQSSDDWRRTSREPMPFADYSGTWSSQDPDRGYQRFSDADRYRDADGYTARSHRPASSWSVDEGRTEPRNQNWGRGPKGYQRSDSRILEEVCDRLMYSDVDAGEIEVKVENGEVTLSGNVHHRSDKRRAEDVAEDVPGVRDVHNNIRVHRHDHGIGHSETSISDQPGSVLGVASDSPATTSTRPKAK
jgi:osmotically-inducible protein OsmY